VANRLRDPIEQRRAREAIESAIVSRPEDDSENRDGVWSDHAHWINLGAPAAFGEIRRLESSQKQ
jgi:hypothetical protein